MKGAANILALIVFAFFGCVSLLYRCDVKGTGEESISGDILEVHAESDFFGYTDFAVTIDLDNGSVVVCPVQSDTYGGTLYRLYHNRKPELPRLRETARVQVGRHSGSVVCRGLVMAVEIEQTGDKQ